MKKLLCLSVALLAIAGGALAQTYDEMLKYNDVATDKIRQIDLLGSILPLLLTKDQINAILPAIEEARQNVRKVRTNEYGVYKSLVPDLDQAIADGEDKNELPSKELLAKLNANLSALDLTREIFIGKNVALVRAVVDKALNKGQIKTAVNNLDPRIYNPSAKPEEMTATQKEDMFIREILLDPRAYDLLVELAKHVR